MFSFTQHVVYIFFFQIFVELKSLIYLLSKLKYERWLFFLPYSPCLLARLISENFNMLSMCCCSREIGSVTVTAECLQPGKGISSVETSSEFAVQSLGEG